MLDLKAQLLQAGLVTEKDVEKVRAEEVAEREKKRAARAAREARQAASGRGGKGGRGPRGGGGKQGGPKRGPPKGRRPGAPKAPASDADIWARRVKKLAAEGRSEQYAAIRSWVEKTRLDTCRSTQGGLPSEDATRFHFEKGEGSISWLTVEPDLAEKLKSGAAGIIAYVGFNGMLFAAVPREVALDIQRVRPEFLRVLSEHTFELLPIVTGKDRRKKERAAAVAAEGGAAGGASDTAVSTAAPPADATSSDVTVPSEASAPADKTAAAKDTAVGVESAERASDAQSSAPTGSQPGTSSSETRQAADDPSSAMQ